MSDPFADEPCLECGLGPDECMCREYAEELWEE